MKEHPSLEDEFIEFLSGVFQNFGLDQLSSKLVGIIFLEPEEVSMEDLAQRTGYSLASLSNKLKTLEASQMVKRVRKPGTKKAFYFIEKDVHEIMRRKMQAMYNQFITPAKTALPNIISRHKGSKMTKDEKQKMDIITNYHRQLLEVEKCLVKHMKELEKS
jgi:DNA-binding transcriptional regulator GbsR (MarR family)